jgi:4-aminobutyrate aminotransferase
MEHEQVRPDILIFAKGVASGLPLSGIAATKSLMDTQPPGSMGGTFGGNAVACAAANATIDAMVDEGMLANTVARGAQLRAGLALLRRQRPHAFRDVRGRGLMVGVEFDAQLYPGIAQRLSAACLKRGMLLLTASVFETVRLIPPLNVTEAEIDECLAIFGDALGDALAAPSKRAGYCSRPQ